MSEAQKSTPDPTFPFYRFAWLSIPLTMKLVAPMVILAGMGGYASTRFSDAARSFVELDPGASLVLLTIGGVLNTLTLALIAPIIPLLLISIPLVKPSRTKKRVESKLYAAPAFLEDVGLAALLLAKRIRDRDEELQLYSDLEALKSDQAKRLEDFLTKSADQATRTNWLVGFVMLVLGAVITLWIERN